MKQLYITQFLLVGFLTAQAGTISGTVTKADDQKPLIAANVVVSGLTNKVLTGSATDENGYYRVPNLPVGNYKVKVNYIGYDTDEHTVSISADQTVTLNFPLERSVIQMETYVVTASRRRERVEDAPAAISVITKADIRRESNTNLGDYMKSMKGVEFTQSGIDSYNFSARGFNASFSSRLLTLTDGRMANVPSLRLIAYNVIPVSFEDVEQIEVVLGPSSALYGPNAHSGVLNIITSSPLTSQGTSINIQGGLLSQTNTDMLQKYTFRTSQKRGNLGFKLSGVMLRGQDWRHRNEDEYEGHDPAFLGRPVLIHDRVNTDRGFAELGSPVFSADWLADEIPGNGVDDNQNGFVDEDSTWIGQKFADGIDNWYLNPGTFIYDGEDNSPVITSAMIATAASDPLHRYYVPNSDVVLYGVTDDWLGLMYSDGIDNDGNGFIDEGFDAGIDNLVEAWYDGIDNDGDGQIDEPDELGNKWLSRLGSYKPVDDFGQNGGFGEYKYDSKGNIIFDTNQDGIYGGEEDFKLNYGGLPIVIKDANDDGIDDFPDFDVRNYRYDFRMDWEPNPDLNLIFSHGYAWARNINITGIARYLADGWQYRYYQGRLRWKNYFFQSYLNTSHSGSEDHPTRNLATGSIIYDRSKKFSAQFQHALEFLNEDLRFVWGLDYFLTMPDTRGTILSDKDLTDKRDNNGNGEAGSPFVFADADDDTWYDRGEGFTQWSVIDSISSEGVVLSRPTLPGGIPLSSEDNVLGAIADGIDNDGDGLIDEGIDEAAEDNRKVVNELGGYYQVNWKINPKWELIHATRLDAHDRLTDLITFNNQASQNYNPFNWDFNLNETDGLQISPKVGIVYRPRENQTFRLTWATAFNTPSNQALFLDIYVTRVSIFKVYARGASGGYIFPRNADGNSYYYNINTFGYVPIDSSQYIYFYPSIDPKIEGFYNHTVNDLPEIQAEQVQTWEWGYKGRLNNFVYGTLDLYTSHYNSFVSPTTFITPIVIKKSVLENDWNGDGIANNIYDVVDNKIADLDDYEESFNHWIDNIVGITAMDTTRGSVPPIVVGYINYGAVDVSGLDASLTWFINRNLTFDIHYSYMNITDFLNPITNAKDPINAPKHKGGFKLQYAPYNKSYSVTISERFVDSFPWSSGVYFGNIKAYSIMDLHSTYEISDNLSAMFSANNVFNHRHTEIIGGPALGRMVVFRLQVKL